LKKLDDKGLTLIELIVTVCIIAVVTAPFLSSFVNASNTNAKASRKQKAASWGQYFLEECKISTLEELKTMYQPSGAYQDLRDTEGAVEGAGTIQIKLSGNQLPEGARKSGFSAVLTLSPKEYTKDGNQILDADGNVSGFSNYGGRINDTAIPDMSDIDGQKSAVIVQEFFEYDTEYIASTGLSADNIIRNVTGKIGYNAARNKFFVEVIAVYSPRVGAGTTESYQIYYKEFANNSKDNKTGDPETTEDDVPDVYMMYPAASNADTVQIINTLPDDTYKADAYIIMQKESAGFAQLQNPNGQINLTHNGVSHACGVKLHVWNDNQSYIDGTSSQSVLNDRPDTVDSLFNVTVSITRNGEEVVQMKSGKEE